MARLIFHYPRVIDKKLYLKSPKAQEVPDKMMEHWFTKALLKTGEVSIPASTVEVEKNSPIDTVSKQVRVSPTR